MHTEKTPRRRNLPRLQVLSGVVFFFFVHARLSSSRTLHITFLNGFLFHMGINSYELGHILRAIFIIKVLI